jgi:hypothetical protein
MKCHRSYSSFPKATRRGGGAFGGFKYDVQFSAAKNTDISLLNEFCRYILYNEFRLFFALMKFIPLSLQIFNGFFVFV